MKITQKGITLIEVLMVVAIAAILVSLGFASYRNLKARYDLINAANKIYADMEWCRQKSMGSAHGYGMYFTSNAYKVFKDLNDNGKFDNADTVLRESDFANITFSGYPTNGYTYSRRGTANRSFTLIIANTLNQTKSIKVSMFKTRMQ